MGGDDGGRGDDILAARVGVRGADVEGAFASATGKVGFSTVLRESAFSITLRTQFRLVTLFGDGIMADEEVIGRAREYVFMGIGLLFHRPRSEERANREWHVFSASSSSSVESGAVYSWLPPIRSSSISDAQDGPSELYA